jgi:hypothetical protein
MNKSLNNDSYSSLIPYPSSFCPFQPPHRCAPPLLSQGGEFWCFFSNLFLAGEAMNRRADGLSALKSIVEFAGAAIKFIKMRPMS